MQTKTLTIKATPLSNGNAKHAAPQEVPDTPEEWLDGFNTFSIYQVLPESIELWGLNVRSQVESKKKFAEVSGSWLTNLIFTSFNRYIAKYGSVC